MNRMRTLLLHLPLTPPGPHASYGQAWVDTAAPSRLQPSLTPLALLPAADRRTPVVVIVPATALSWHRVTLPPGLGRGGQRLLAALQGLLEDRLLQDPAQVHMALAPDWQAGVPTWVAVCDKAWLDAHLQALQDADLAVQRLVPEFAPPAQDTVWYATGDEHTGWLWCCSADQGVSGWPVPAASCLPTDCWGHAPLLAEPGLAAWARERLPSPVSLVDTTSHWLSAVQGSWDLAQFAMAARLRQRGWMRWRQRLDALWRQPQWRPARWGLLAVVLAQLIGLNAWAWMTRQQWQAQQDSWARLLQESFPKVTVVVDAPMQMAREVERLQQGSGQLTPADFESLLQVLGTALPAGVSGPERLIYQDGVLQWPPLAMSAAQQTAFGQALTQQGHVLQTQGDLWRLHSRESRP